MQAINVVNSLYERLNNAARIPLAGPLFVSPLTIITGVADLAISNFVLFLKRDSNLLSMHISLVKKCIGLHLKNIFSLVVYLWWKSLRQYV